MVRRQSHRYALILAALVFATPASAQYAPYKVTDMQGWVSFDDSYFGSVSSGALVARNPAPPFVLTETLGRNYDTTGHATVNIGSGCTWSDFTTALTSARNTSSSGADDVIVQFPTNCQVAYTGTQYTFTGDDRDIVIRGNADGLSALEYRPTGADGTGIGFSATMFVFQGGGPIATWVWTAGDKTSDIVTATGVTDICAGDIVRVEVDSFSADTEDFRRAFEVVGAIWSDGTTNVGDTAGLTTNQIRLSDPVGFDRTGSDYGETFTGQNVVHISRLSDCDGPGGHTVDSNMPVRVGFEDFTILNQEPGSLRDFRQVAQFYGSYEHWEVGMTFDGAWSNSWYRTQNDTTGSYRTLLTENHYIGRTGLVRVEATYEVTNILTVNSGVTTNHLTIDIPVNRPGICGGTIDDWALTFRSGFGSGTINTLLGTNELFRCSCSDTGADCASGSPMRVTLYDREANALEYGSSLPAQDPGGDDYMARLNEYGIAGSYAQQGTSDFQVINNIFEDVRVSHITQDNGGPGVFAYNYITHPTTQCSRGYFNHGGGSFWLIEANDSDCPYVQVASAGTPDGHAMQMWAYNRGRERTGLTGTLQDQCSPNGGYICNENSTQTHDNQWQILIGNHLPGVTGGAICFGSSNFSNCEVHRNIWYVSSDMNVRVGSQANTPDIDLGTNYPVDKALSPAWDGMSWASSPLYDSLGAIPSWWCAELSDTWPAIGAKVDDDNAGSPTYAKLPAQVRYESGTCTAR